jgi:hypothetical protein
VPAVWLAPGSAARTSVPALLVSALRTLLAPPERIGQAGVHRAGLCSNSCSAPATSRAGQETTVPRRGGPGTARRTIMENRGVLGFFFYPRPVSAGLIARSSRPLPPWLYVRPCY